MEVMIGLLLFTCALFSETSALTRTACENSRLYLTCEPQGKIHIISASYGRPRADICPTNPTCHSTVTQIHVRIACQDKSNCSILASNSVFGDPCPGIYKYLVVNYACKYPPVFNICEFDLQTFSCHERGKVIDIVNAFYGRMDRTTCPNDDIHTTSCIAFTSRAIVQATCNGRSSCTLYASNNVFGDPCRGTFKYLYVAYRCIDQPVGEISICENQKSTIVCPLGIQIDEAFYGRENTATCPHASGRDISCKRNVIFIVEGICDRQTHCSLEATNSIYGDPCRGVYKYLYVRYRCL